MPQKRETRKKRSESKDNLFFIVCLAVLFLAIVSLLLYLWRPEIILDLRKIGETIVSSKPADSKMVAPKPVEPKPAHLPSTIPAPTEPEPSESKLIESEPIVSEPTESEPIISEPIKSNPTEPVPIEPEPTEPKTKTNHPSSIIEVIKEFFGIEKPVTEEPAPPPLTPDTPSDILPNITDPSLIFGSFFDSFSGTAFIDQPKSDLYQDRNATAVFFPPDYEWQEESGDATAQFPNYFNSFIINNFKGPYSDRRCLATDCLEQWGNELHYNGQTLSYPNGLKSTDIAAVSIAALTRRWLVGFTLKDGTAYRGEIFYFDGQNFTQLDAVPAISSTYFGLFGFGGEEDDFLAIYSAYQGAAYRVRAGSATDISRFFSIRVMNNGFKPEVIRVNRSGDVSWYIFSSSSYNPRLIKLWQNGTTEIMGQTVFEKLFDYNVASAIFKLKKVAANEITFLAKVRVNDQDTWRIFIDRGFKNSQSGTLYFNPISRASSFSLEKVAIARLGLDATDISVNTSVKLQFSADSQNWRDVPTTENANFSAPDLKQFFLRVIFPAVQDKFESPFLTEVLFDYYYKK